MSGGWLGSHDKIRRNPCECYTERRKDGGILFRCGDSGHIVPPVICDCTQAMCMRWLQISTIAQVICTCGRGFGVLMWFSANGKTSCLTRTA